MYRRPAYYDRGSQPRFSTLQFSPRLASPRFVPSFLFSRSTDRTERSNDRASPFLSASYLPPFPPVFRTRVGEGEGRRPSSGSRITGKEVIENAVPVYRVARMCICLLSILEAIISFLNCETALRVTHVDTYIACISVPTNVYPYTRGNENDRYFSILLEGRVRLRNFRESEIRARYYRGEGRERVKNRGKIVDDGSQVREWMESTARSGVIRLRSDACSVITARRDSTRVLSICPLAVRLPVKRSDDKLLRPTFLSTGVVVPRPPCKFFRGASSSHHWHASKQASSELRLFSLISIFARRDRIRYYRSFRHSR